MLLAAGLLLAAALAGWIPEASGPLPARLVDHLPHMLLLCLWFAAVTADQRALGPLVLHEPLVAAGVGGLILGHPTEGWWVGLMMQAIWPGLLPLGGSFPPLAGAGALVGTTWLAWMPPAAGAWGPSVALGAALACSGVGIRIEERLRRCNERREERIFTAGHEERATLLQAHGCLGLIEAGAAGLFIASILVVLPLALLSALSPMLTGPAAVGEAHAQRWVTPASVGLFALGGVLGYRLRDRWPRRGSGRVERRAQDPSSPAGTDADAPQAEPPPLSWRGWLALLALQSAFSSRSLQRAGFLRYLRVRLGEASHPRVREAARQLEEQMCREGTINTQPVMAAALLGATERVVADAAREAPPRPVLRLVELGGSVLAQWGDRAVWGGARPLWALIALALVPLAPLPAVALYAAGGLALELGARGALHRWGWRRGWQVVRRGTGRLWRGLPVWCERMQIPLALLAAVTLWVGLVRPAPAPAMGALAWALLSFILGVPLGALSGRRALIWGWICWGWGVLAVVGARWLIG